MATKNATIELWEVIQTEEDKSTASVIMSSSLISRRLRLTKSTTDNKSLSEETREDCNFQLSREEEDWFKKKKDVNVFKEKEKLLKREDKKKLLENLEQDKRLKLEEQKRVNNLK